MYLEALPPFPSSLFSFLSLVSIGLLYARKCLGISDTALSKICAILVHIVFTVYKMFYLKKKALDYHDRKLIK